MTLGIAILACFIAGAIAGGALAALAERHIDRDLGDDR